MPKIDEEEAKRLAYLFGEIGPKSKKNVQTNRIAKRLKFLRRFHKPQSRYDVALEMDQLRKDERVPTPTAYRNINSLSKSGFLEKHNHRPQTRGESEQDVGTYEISVKGRIAEAICSYHLYYQKGTSEQEKNRLAALIKKFESDRHWNVVIDFLKWHADRNADLSSIRIDWRYVFLIAALRSFERERQGVQIEDDEMEEFLQLARDFFLELDERNWNEEQNSADSVGSNNFWAN